MIHTIRTYDSNDDRKLGVTISYLKERGGKATFSLYAGDEGVTVDLTPDDHAALADIFAEARYATAKDIF